MTPFLPPTRPRVTVRPDRFPFERALDQGRHDVEVITVEIAEGRLRGRGECRPQARFGESIEAVVETIERLAPDIETGVLTRRGLQKALPPGAARSAIDCALWDFDAKRGEASVWQIAGLGLPHRLLTAYRLPPGTPEAMAAAALEEAHRPLLKLNLSGPDAMAQLAAVRAAVPRARLIIDANAAWTADTLVDYLPHLTRAGVELIEQPLPPDQDAALADIARTVPIAADESCCTIDDLDRLTPRYNAITIKLEKAGGLTAALDLMDAAQTRGFKIMVGCRLGTSLGVAPAVFLAQNADWVDLDAPLLLARDRQPGLRFDGSLVYPPSGSLWG